MPKMQIKEMFKEADNHAVQYIIDNTIAQFKKHSITCAYVGRGADTANISNKTYRDDYFFKLENWIPVSMDDYSISFKFDEKTHRELYYETLLHQFYTIDEMVEYLNQSNISLHNVEKLKKPLSIGVFENHSTHDLLQTAILRQPKLDSGYAQTELEKAIYEYFESKNMRFVKTSETEPRVLTHITNFSFFATVDDFPFCVYSKFDNLYFSKKELLESAKLSFSIDTFTLNKQNPIIFQKIEDNKLLTKKYDDLDEICALVKSFKESLLKVGQFGIFERLKRFNDFNK